MAVIGAIDEQRLTKVVAAFYVRVSADDLLGPVFAGAVDDWPAHLRLLADFWSSIMLTSGRYKGNPVAAHLRHVDELTTAHFARWLTLWGEVTSTQLDAGNASALQAKAARIAQSLQLALFLKLPTPAATAPVQCVRR